MLFKSRTVDEASVQSQYLENIGHKMNIQVVPNKKSIGMLPRKERRSGKEKKRR
jgi:hypothetical protein